VPTLVVSVRAALGAGSLNETAISGSTSAGAPALGGLVGRSLNDEAGEPLTIAGCARAGNAGGGSGSLPARS
jgi:hypothetical protein